MEFSARDFSRSFVETNLHASSDGMSEFSMKSFGAVRKLEFFFSKFETRIEIPNTPDAFEKFNDAPNVIFQFNGHPRRKSSVDAIWTSRISPSIINFAHWYLDHVGFHMSL